MRVRQPVPVRHYDPASGELVGPGRTRFGRSKIRELSALAVTARRLCSNVIRGAKRTGAVDKQRHLGTVWGHLTRWSGKGFIPPSLEMSRLPSTIPCLRLFSQANGRSGCRARPIGPVLTYASGDIAYAGSGWLCIDGKIFVCSTSWHAGRFGDSERTGPGGRQLATDQQEHRSVDKTMARSRPSSRTHAE